MENFEKVREILQQQRKEIISGAEKVLQSTVEKGVQLFPDPSDLASIEESLGFSYRLKEREKKLLRKIDEALERIETGSFGICERCGEEIEEKRMLARPVTILAASGLAQIVAALRALSAEGIQKGHMSLHARSIAISVGAMGEEVDAVSQAMVLENNVSMTRAKEILEAIRSGKN